MTTVYIVQGTHWSQSGSPISAHSTAAAADAQALALLNVMRSEVELPASDCLGAGLESLIEHLYDECLIDGTEPDVWVTPLPLDAA